MNRINKLFTDKHKDILSIYFTAGFPQLDNTAEILNALITNGADLIEIGMPYSDPLADGPVIQQSSMQALQNGMSIKLLFEQLQNFKATHPAARNVPFILMGYLNPVIQFGIKKFCAMARACDIDGIILPDLPTTEYENEYRELFEKNDLNFVFLVTPETSEQRIRKIDELCNGFIYAVSSSSITGADKNMDAQQHYFQRLQSMGLKNKLLIGFGIKDHATFTAACKYAAGAIIGTAYIRAIENSSNISSDTADFLNSILHQ